MHYIFQYSPHLDEESYILLPAEWTVTTADTNRSSEVATQTENTELQSGNAQISAHAIWWNRRYPQTEREQLRCQFQEYISSMPGDRDAWYWQPIEQAILFVVAQFDGK